MSWCEGFPPLLAPGARVLILGSMPGAASLRAQAYYAHPRNAFWPIMGALYGFEPAAPYDVRCAALTSAGVAVWDVLQACERPGSLDAAIVADSRVANDFSGLFAQQPTIRRILFNGATAEQLFRRLVLAQLGPNPSLELIRLPSTSPAHAGMPLAEKCARWAAALANELPESA